MTDAPPASVVDDHAGDGVIRLSWIGTALYGVLAVLTTVTTSFVAPLVAVTMVMFLLGLLAFVATYAVAVSRSREDLIGMGGLFFLAGSTAPPRVRRQLMGSLAAQVVLAIVTASIGMSRFPADVTNPLAFGFMASLFELSLAGWWGARYGTFAPRPPDPPRRGAAGRRAAPAPDDDPHEGPAGEDDGDLSS